MSADEILPIESRVADVRRAGRRVTAAVRREIPGGSALFEEGTAR